MVDSYKIEGAGTGSETGKIPLWLTAPILDDSWPRL